MDAATIDRYNQLAAEWIEASAPESIDLAQRLGADVRDDNRAVDLGCGPGWHLPLLANDTIGLDASGAMAAEAKRRTGHPVVHADLEHLPFRSQSVDLVWAAKSYVHLPRKRVPLAFHDLHRVIRPGGRAALTLFLSDREDDISGKKVPGRLFSFWPDELLEATLGGAGLSIEESENLHEGMPGVRRTVVVVRRERTLADTVGPDMGVLLTGLNPSLHAADAGFGFAGPGNRFWPAALDSGIATVDRDPVALLRQDRVGMTDLVKRATARADEISNEEYRSGLGRLEHLCSWLEPGVVCVIGITGWRAATGDRSATLGIQPRELGGRPVYVMPNPSGLNAHTNHDDLVQHFRAVQDLAKREARSQPAI